MNNKYVLMKTYFKTTELFIHTLNFLLVLIFFIPEMYNCPCYLDFERSHHLFSIPLNPGLSTAEHWVLRSVALIITLD